MKKLLGAIVISSMLLLPGCNATNDANTAEEVIATTLSIAQAEEPVLPPADAAILTPWVNLGVTLNGQLKTCIGLSGTSKSKFATCFQTFASGLLSTQELAQLRILSPGSQSKVQLYVTAIITAIGVIVALTTPQIAAQPTTQADLQSFAKEHGYARELAYARGQ